MIKTTYSIKVSNSPIFNGFIHTCTKISDPTRVCMPDMNSDRSYCPGYPCKIVEEPTLEAIKRRVAPFMIIGTIRGDYTIVKRTKIFGLFTITKEIPFARLQPVKSAA